MTSLSRRKHQTTPRNTPAETPTDTATPAKHVHEAYALAAGFKPEAQPIAEPMWLPAGLLAVIATLVTAITAMGGEVADSGWASTGGTIRITTPVRHVSPAVSQANHVAPVNALRPAAGLRMVAFEEEVQPGRARLESVVVEQAGQRRGFRIAQEDNLLESFREPFGDEPAAPVDEFEEDLPGFDSPELDPLPPMDSGEPSTADPQVAPSPSDQPGRLQDIRPEDIDRPRSRPNRRQNRSADQSRSETYQSCSEELAKLKASRISEISLAIRPTGEAGEDYPIACSIDDGTPFMDRCWPQICYMWKASALCHKPLYFENVQLERYGHSWGPHLQPIMSGIHFFGTVPLLPYHMGLKAPNECVYTLGHYRPGSCAPYMIPAIPITKRAVLMEAAAVTGGIYAIP